MSQTVTIDLATPAYAECIALMSRDLIEAGLGWSWTRPRVLRQIMDRETVVLLARCGSGVAGFAIMHYLEEHAHLNLLAVAAPHRRVGVGRNMVAWLEKSASVAGITTAHLEVRAGNHAARSFYRALGYREAGMIPGYYRGCEAAVRMVHDLRVARPQYPEAPRAG